MSYSDPYFWWLFALTAAIVGIVLVLLYDWRASGEKGEGYARRMLREKRDADAEAFTEARRADRRRRALRHEGKR